MTTVATEVLPSVSWPEWFNTRQNVDLAIENTPYINASVTELGNSDGPNYIRTPRGENLPGSESLLQYLRRSELLGNFCGQINLRDLENGTTENTTKYVASLDDRNSAGVLPLARRQCRPYKGPLTQHGLYQELRRKRFRVDDEGKTQQTVDDALESDIERRFLNIINMDRWGAVALIATASATQIQALGTAIENYLAFQASVRVTIPSSLPHIFALEFHIPYYGLRIHNSLVNDPRKRSDGSPLRHSWKLPFPETLSMPYHTPTGTCCLYEAQLSVAVIGLDRWTWIAYAFDDTYFDYDTLEPFTQFTAQIRPSLISPRDGDEPVWTPREHFLKTVEIKTKQVVKEWGSIVQKLQEIVRCSRMTNGFQWSLTRSGFTNYSKQSAQHTTWIISMTNILRQVLDSLSRTNRAWDMFYRSDIRYFLHTQASLDNTPTTFIPLHNIQRLFLDLKGFEQDLQDLERELSESFKLQASIERMDIMKLQRSDTKNSSLNATYNVVFFPVVLTVGILNVAPGALPFSPSFITFLLMVLLFYFLMFFAQTLFLTRRRVVIYNGICASIRRCFYRKYKEAELRKLQDLEVGRD